MAWNQNVPQPTDDLDKSQADLLGNFQSLNWVGNGYADIAVQAGAPTFAAGNNGIYSLLNGTTGVNELYVHHQTNDAPTDVPFTASKMSNTAIASCDSGWAYMPSGILIKWGKQAVATAGSYQTIDVATNSGGPAFNRAFEVIASPYNTGAYLAIYAGTGSFLSTTTGNFEGYLSAANANTGIRYLVIGV